MRIAKTPPFSVVILLVVFLLMVVLALVFLNLTSPVMTRALAGGGTVGVLVVGGGLLFWVVRRLEVSEARLSMIVESVSDGIVTTDECGYIETVNTSAVAMLGYRPGQMRGSRITILLSSTYWENDEYSSLMAFLRDNQLDASGMPHEVRGLRRDGSSFAMDFSVNAAYLDERLVYTITMRDVTERHEAEAALKRVHDELEARVCMRTADLEAVNKQLQCEITQRKKTQEEREALIQELQSALAEIKVLSGLLPICAHCKKIRDDQGYWSQIEVYIRDHSDAEFSHGICPECAKELYPGLKLSGGQG